MIIIVNAGIIWRRFLQNESGTLELLNRNTRKLRAETIIWIRFGCPCRNWKHYDRLKKMNSSGRLSGPSSLPLTIIRLCCGSHIRFLQWNSNTSMAIKRGLLVFQLAKEAPILDKSVTNDKAWASQEVQGVMNGEKALGAALIPRIATWHKASAKPLVTTSASRLMFWAAQRSQRSKWKYIYIILLYIIPLGQGRHVLICQKAIWTSYRP